MMYKSPFVRASRHDLASANLASDLGVPPKMGWIDKNLIDVDKSYQRELNQFHVQTILMAFDWRLFSPITVAQSLVAPGRWTTPDGQHRLEACKMHPAISSVPCWIVNLPTLQEQASVFIKMNQFRAVVTGIEKYWAGIAAEDPMCLKMSEILDSCRVQVVQRLGYKANRTTNSISALFRALHYLGEDALRFSLNALVAAYPETPEAFNETFITALARYKHHNPDVGLEPTVVWLKNHPAKILLGKLDTLARTNQVSKPSVMEKLLEGGSFGGV